MAATGAVIARAQGRFGSHLSQHRTDIAEAVLVEYFKQGDSFFQRFRRALVGDPNHKVCPGEGGCRFLHNRDQLADALAGRIPIPQPPSCTPGPLGHGEFVNSDCSITFSRFQP